MILSCHDSVIQPSLHVAPSLRIRLMLQDREQRFLSPFPLFAPVLLVISELFLFRLLAEDNPPTDIQRKPIPIAKMTTMA